MMLVKRGATIVSFAMIGLASPAWAQGARDAIKREVEAQTRAMSVAFARGDMLAVSRFYADDAAMYSPSGHVIRGRAELDRLWRRIEHPKSWTMTTIELGGSADEPHQLVESVLVEEHGGDRSVSRVYCLFLWRRGADGRLRVSVDMYTPMKD